MVRKAVKRDDGIDEAKSLICEMCRNFYNQGWVSGTGGGMSIKVGEKIVMAPSGVQKERMQQADMFVLDAAGNILETPRALPPPAKPPKLSECSPLFMSAYELRNAGAVLHSHSINAVMATMLQEGNKGKGCVGEFRVTNLEMIKGIAGHGYYDTCVVPIIDNTARECELTASLREAIKNYPKANAVLVKRHGVYVWGDNWIQAKTQAECYEYLFEAAVKLHTLNIDVSQPPAVAQQNGVSHVEEDEQPASKKAKLSQTTKPSAIVLDIEGTITPISFVTETLFPYARQHLESHLQETYESDETQADIALLQDEARKACNAAGVSQPCDLASIEDRNKEGTVKAVISYVTTLMTEDKKSTGLKSLQGHIWRKGFDAGELKGQLFSDVAAELQKWHSQGIKVYIYSSGSREAQRMLMANSSSGDLRSHISGFFDTAVGPKVDAASYKEIFMSLGLDDSKSVLFATDNIEEAEAAEKSGWSVALAVRPGNATLPPDAATRFRIVKTMDELLHF